MHQRREQAYERAAAAAAGERNGAAEGRDRPAIDAGCEDLTIITREAWDAILAANEPPQLFRHGGAAARIETDDGNMPVVKALTFERMRHSLARAALWLRRKKVDGEQVWLPALPPKAVVEDVLASPNQPLPVLTRIVEAPVFAPDGSLQTSPGYSAASRTYLWPDARFRVPEVPRNPTGKQRETAAKFLLNELLGDFPFVSDAEKTHALALLILPFVRELIDGPTPLHLVEKPTPGTGGTLLVDALTYPALGRPVPAMTEGRAEDEWRKRVFAKLRGGPAVVLIDNLRRRLDSAAIASAITAFPSWEDRILGVSETCRVPVRCAWVATGNNPALSGELARRTVRIRLDAKTDRPWLRSGFRHANLRSWMTENRGQIVYSTLTLVCAWLRAGRPEGERTIGMFETWAKVMGGILEVAEVPDFLGNLTDFYEQADTEGEAWRAFVSAWWERFGEHDAGVSDLWPLVANDGLLDLGKESERSQRTRLGRMLSENRDRVFTVEDNRQLRIERAGTSRRATQWRLREVGGSV
jgi:hypothetical protein